MRKDEHKQDKLNWAQNEVNPAKERMIEVMWQLEEAGLIRESKSLGTIIDKLERWQHK